jgi:bifunctional DNA-binding transcriptional regulator/antitoxin component of YhaV-PrlF toxin-antitoxin module
MVKRSLLGKQMKEVAIVKVQRRPTGSFMVTIPIEIIRDFDIKPRDKVKVLVEREPMRIIYEPIRE